MQWLRDNLGLIRTSAEIETLAALGAGQRRRLLRAGVLRPVRAVLGADARGVIAGLTRYATAGHIARAALEATAYQTLRSDRGDGAAIPAFRISTLRVDGGMVVNELLMQFQADILDVPVVRPRSTETTALGAAYAAGLAVGYWQQHRMTCCATGRCSTHGRRRCTRSSAQS